MNKVASQLTTLPWDCYRCAPQITEEKCTKCLRWKDIEGQTWGPRTPLSFAVPDGEGCDFIPHYPSEEIKK
jgi:hypothetical protein